MNNEKGTLCSVGIGPEKERAGDTKSVQSKRC